MKTRKLTLNRETITQLTQSVLPRARGGVGSVADPNDIQPLCGPRTLSDCITHCNTCATQGG